MSPIEPIQSGLLKLESDMRRREFITLFGLLSLGGAAALWRNLASMWRPRLDAHVAETVRVVTDLMFPGDGLPGATELGIHKRIVAMTNLQALMTDGVAWLDRRAVSRGAPNFLGLNEAGKPAAIQDAFVSKDLDARQFVQTIRFYAGLEYSSEPLIKASFSYTGPPQPDGFADFQNPPK
jgi:gluconate 2-dehydrogenase subunit 3-like protein